VTEIYGLKVMHDQECTTKKNMHDPGMSLGPASFSIRVSSLALETGAVVGERPSKTRAMVKISKMSGR
jgi:hypothetical protein